MSEIIALQAAEDYADLPRYNRISQENSNGNIHKYDDESHFWDDILGHRGNENRLRPHDKVFLKGFAVSQWIPRVPGLFWKNESRLLRQEAFNGLESYDQGILIFDPLGKTMRILGGIGNLRLLPNSSGRLICASSSGEYWRGIPILLNEDAWHACADLYSGSIVDIQGNWELLPHEQSILIGADKGIPRGCIIVSDITRRGYERQSIPGSCAAWSLYEYRDENMLLNYSYTYRTFQIDCSGKCNTIGQYDDNEEIDRASLFIEDYLEHRGGIALTDFDETEPRFNAFLPVSEVMSQEIDHRKLRSFVERVKNQALSPEVIRYNALPGILMRNFSLEELGILAIDYVRVDLEALIAPIAGKASQVDALIRYCEEKDLIKDLIMGCIQSVPRLETELAI